MAARKSYLLRIEPGMFALLEKWAADECRSVNGQIEFLLRESLKRAGRLKSVDASASPPEPAEH